MAGAGRPTTAAGCAGSRRGAASVPASGRSVRPHRCRRRRRSASGRGPHPETDTPPAHPWPRRAAAPMCANGGNPLLRAAAISACARRRDNRRPTSVCSSGCSGWWGLQPDLAGAGRPAGASGHLDQQLRQLSLARKSAENNPSSMPTTTTMLSCGRSWPLARICAPTRMPGCSPSRANCDSSASRRGRCRGRCAAPDRRQRLRSGALPSVRSPRPAAAGPGWRNPGTPTAPAGGRRSDGTAARPPPCTVIGARCSGVLQRLHAAVQPQSWHSKAGA